LKNLKVVLATYGTHGDLHPFIAVGLGLRDHGFDPVIASHEQFRHNVQAAGLAFQPLRPSLEGIESDLNMSRPEMLRAARAHPQIIMTKFFLPYLRQSYEDAFAVMRDARVVFTNSVAYGPKLAAEKLQLPHVSVILQPYTLLSAYDPPLLSNYERLSRWVYSGGPHSARAFLQLVRFTSRMWARPIDQFRRQIGLPRISAHPFFEGQFSGARALGLYSRVLGDLQPDFPPGFVIGGFAFYDGDAAAGSLSSKLYDFLERGPPPLVFTLGTSAVHDSSRFVQVAREAVRQLGARAIMVLDEPSGHGPEHPAVGDVMITGYVPYSRLFPRAKVIIHHGGIGTTAQALRSGRPQLVTPYFVDQPDNAARLERLGLARVIPHDRWTATRVIHGLKALAEDLKVEGRALAVASDIAREDGVRAAMRIATEIVTGR
jgi:UDP:flavonoid glycosyltransferase YjiC (YdhE family)